MRLLILVKENIEIQICDLDDIVDTYLANFAQFKQLSRFLNIPSVFMSFRQKVHSLYLYIFQKI